MASPISAGLAAALIDAEQVPISKVEVLDGISRAVLNTITTVDEGTVTVDVGRATRRTFQLRLSNKNGAYTPINSNDQFYFNRLIRPYRGNRYLSTTTNTIVDEYVLLGTFMVDRPEVFVERNMSVLTVDGSDLWKKIATGGFASGSTYASGTHINTIIRDVAIAAGISSNNIFLSQYPTRTTAGYQTATTVQWEEGASRSEFLMNMASQWGIQIYFDVYGNLVSAEMPNLDLTSPVWTFQSDANSIMLGVTKTLNDLKLVNHILVTGEASSGVSSSARYEISDSDPNSPTYTGLIGDRLLRFTGPQITTLEQATVVGKKLYAENCLLEEDLKLPITVLPHLEGNDVIRVIESTFAKISSTYLAQRFDIPLRESRMTIESKKARAV